MSNALNQLLQRFDDRSAVIGILGLGYVGLPLAMRYVEAGYKVIGFDVDPNKVEMLNEFEVDRINVPAPLFVSVPGLAMVPAPLNS